MLLLKSLGGFVVAIAQINQRYTAIGKTKDELAEENQRLVHKVVHSYRDRGIFSSQQDYDEYFAVGSLGLAKAIAFFDADRGFRFSSFAVPYIRGEINHYLRDRLSLLKVPAAWRTSYQKGKYLSSEDAAAKLQIPVAEWLEIKQACSSGWQLELPDSVSKDYGLEIESPEPLDRLNLALNSIDKARSNPGLAEEWQVVDQFYFGGKRWASKQRQLCVSGVASHVFRLMCDHQK